MLGEWYTSAQEQLHAFAYQTREVHRKGNGGDFLIQPGNSEALKEKMNIFDYVNMKMFCVTKGIINKASSNGEAGKIFVM